MVKPEQHNENVLQLSVVVGDKKESQVLIFNTNTGKFQRTLSLTGKIPKVRESKNYL